MNVYVLRHDELDTRYPGYFTSRIEAIYRNRDTADNKCRELRRQDLNWCVTEYTLIENIEGGEKP